MFRSDIKPTFSTCVLICSLHVPSVFSYFPSLNQQISPGAAAARDAALPGALKGAPLRAKEAPEGSVVQRKHGETCARPSGKLT